MTRINTNVISLNAQKSLARSNVQLQEALTRLSTGLRINVGKDDPAGLIASEELRSDMVSVQQAISNAQRANQVIAIADSALGEVSSLLNDIRALVTEAANTGAMSHDQIAANQLQVDSSLEALNRIAQTTMFQGRKLLDGSLDFIISAGTNYDTVVADIEIQQANLGTAGALAVDVDISVAAAKAEITNTGFTVGAAATAKLNFAPSAKLVDADADTVSVFANDVGDTYKGVTVQAVGGGTAGSEVATYNATSKTLTVQIESGVSTVAQVAAAINDQVEEFSAISATVGDGNYTLGGTDTDTTDVDYIDIEWATAGPENNNVSVRMEAANLGAGLAQATYDAVNKEVVVTVDDDTEVTLNTVATAIAGLAEINTATESAGVGSDTVYAPSGDVEASANTEGTGGGKLNDDLLLELSGALGMEVFQFESGATINSVVAAVNLVSDATGVEAAFTGNGASAPTLTLNSTGYGSDVFVAANVLSEGVAGTFKTNLSTDRDYGTDINATVNGLTASGRGNGLSINTAMLDLSITVSDGSSTNFEFTIAGGGALFQLGPEVVTNQQARLGIPNVNTAKLGGQTGRLYELASGQSAALGTDPNKAAQILEQVITKVTSLRGRLGAFQRTTLEVNINSLSDTLENLTAAESMIRDADFAAESAALTRAQILVQSGTSVLAVANTSPQNVLALLR